MLALHRAAKKQGLDLATYNDVKREIAEIEYDLRRLKDPLYKDLSLTPPKSSTYSSTEIETSKKLKAFLSENNLLGSKSNTLEKLTNVLESATKRLKTKK